MWFAGAQAAGPESAPKVLTGLPVGQGSWRVEMFDGPQAAEMRKNFPNGLTMCTTAAKAMVQDLPKRAPRATEAEDSCDTKVVENSASKMITETRCKGGELNKVTMTRQGAKSLEMLNERTGAGKTEQVRVRMTYLGTCSANDAVVSGAKGSPMCEQLQGQLTQMDPAVQCKGSGDSKAMCMNMMADARAKMEAMCK